MPDFTVVTMQHCRSIDGPMSARVGPYTIGGLFSERDRPWCDCSAFKFAKRDRMGEKTCKHITQVQGDACGWHEQWGEVAQTEFQEENMVCPQCGGATVFCRVAV
jgi:hypothetical protein